MDPPESIDFQELERELAVAVAADEKYKRENDAKFRAIHQKVSSYEEFRDLVLAANLKPLEKKDKIGTERKQPWNPAATVSGPTKESDCSVSQASEAEPKNAFEFTREWRRWGMDKRYDFLLQLGAEKLSQLFPAEICSGLLGEFITSLEEKFQSVHQAEVLKILQSLTKTKRFDLNLIFLSRSEKESCKKLFIRLMEVHEMNHEDAMSERDKLFTNVMALYKVSDPRH
ncbi:coiled-coil domain-containing protein 103 [Spea bombifrons]|uniref:coiled-coil domain-containing protein 103 n=1 Tax=Spea bombifrons TaxID=233779 RepID=UPI00234A554C|nr:coiled-coil domain-containing protein 103 [Spea bombifrons]